MRWLDEARRNGMDLNTVTAVVRPSDRQHLIGWRPGDAWLGGGTWLFSETQPQVKRLIDLESLGWPSIEVNESHVSVAATCRIAELRALTGPAEWTALPLVAEACSAFLSSFKIWNAATVGGNICMSLPAGPMTSLMTALQGVCKIWAIDGSERHVPIEQFVTGNHQNVLRPGELLRSIEVPQAVLRTKTAFRQVSLTHLGRSAALLIGTLSPPDGPVHLTISAATIRPIRIEFPTMPTEAALRASITDTVPDDLYLEDVHGDPAYRKHMTYLFAEQIRRELAGGVV
jgi:CO/xanthine dehydrogenase FAD-binding subunit